MKRRLRSLRLHILLPVLVMTLVLVVLLTVLISRIYISMSVRQESRKNAASFEAIAHELNKTVSASIADVHQIMIDPRVTAYACHQFATDAELVRARMECRDYLRAQINRDSAIYGLLFMRPDGSLFGTLPESNVFRDDRKDVALTDGVIDRILEVPLGETAWVGPLTGSELYGYESGKLPDSVMAATWKFVSVEAGECYALMLMDDAVFRDMFSLLDDGNSALHLFTADGAEFFRQGGDSGLDAGVLISEESSGRIFKNDRNESWCVFTMPLASSGWTLAREVLMGEYEQTIRRMQTTVWAMAMSILAAGLGFYLFWLNRFMRSINALKAGIARLGRGDLTPMTGASFQTEELAGMMRELDKASVSLNVLMSLALLALFHKLLRHRNAPKLVNHLSGHINQYYCYSYVLLTPTSVLLLATRGELLPGTLLPLMGGLVTLAVCYLVIEWQDRKGLPNSITKLKMPWKAVAFAVVWIATIAIFAYAYPRITEYATIWNDYLGI